MLTTLGVGAGNGSIRIRLSPSGDLELSPEYSTSWSELELELPPLVVTSIYLIEHFSLEEEVRKTYSRLGRVLESILLYNLSGQVMF